MCVLVINLNTFCFVQLIGTYAPKVFTTPIDAYSTFITLLIVLLVTSIKEAVEDVERARSDRDENKSQVTVVIFDRDGVEVEHVIDRSKVSLLSDVIKKLSPPRI